MFWARGQNAKHYLQTFRQTDTVKYKKQLRSNLDDKMLSVSDGPTDQRECLGKIAHRGKG